MPVVSVESPYTAPDTNTLHLFQAYAMVCCEYATKRGYAPYASHLINTAHWRKFTDQGCGNPYVGDTGFEPEYAVVGREAAIALTHEMRRRCDEVWFFVDFGESAGMTDARQVCADAGIPTRDIKLTDEGLEWSNAIEELRGFFWTQ